MLLPFFVSPLPHQQNISLWGLFSSRKTTTTKKVTQGEIRWIGRVGYGGHAILGQKLLNTQHGVGRCAPKSPIMRWANMLKESSKKIHWSLSQPLTTTPNAGFLEHSPKWGKLDHKGACPPEDNSRFFWVPPHMYLYICECFNLTAFILVISFLEVFIRATSLLTVNLNSSS